MVDRPKIVMIDPETGDEWPVDMEKYEKGIRKKLIDELEKILGAPQTHEGYGRSDMLDVTIVYFPAEKVLNALKALRNV